MGICIYPLYRYALSPFSGTGGGSLQITSYSCITLPIKNAHEPAPHIAESRSAFYQARKDNGTGHTPKSTQCALFHPSFYRRIPKRSTNHESYSSNKVPETDCTGSVRGFWPVQMNKKEDRVIISYVKVVGGHEAKSVGTYCATRCLPERVSTILSGLQALVRGRR
jgi:hypothetical protein